MALHTLTTSVNRFQWKETSVQWMKKDMPGYQEGSISSYNNNNNNIPGNGSLTRSDSSENFNPGCGYLSKKSYVSQLIQMHITN